MRSVLLAGLVVAAAVAGCFSNESNDDGSAPPVTGGSSPSGDFVPAAFDANGLPVPVLLCRPMLPDSEPLHASPERCNLDMTPDDGRQGNEVTIAVNPMNPQNIVGGAKDYYPPDAGECVWDGIYVTHDGGRTLFEDRSFDGSPWRAVDGDPTDFQPNYASQFWCTTDPVAYFDVNGNLYYLLMAYQADRVTGSKIGSDTELGGLNDWAFNRAVQIVAKSTDGGDTFDTFTPVLEGSFPVNFHDKGWVAASRSGVIHVMWLGIPTPGNLYFRSTDGGQTFPAADMELLAGFGQGSGQGSFLDVGTNYEVYALWTSGTINLRRSVDDGETWLPLQNLVDPHGVTMPGLSGRDRRGGFPGMATDRNPFSPFADAVHIVFQDACYTDVWSDTCDSFDNGSSIYAMHSYDKGVSFSTPVRISGLEERYRIFPAVSVSPGGVVDVSWMEEGDRIAPASNTDDDDAPHATLEQAYTYSINGGMNWSVPFQVRDAGDGGWDPAFSHHQNSMIFIGDYNDIDSSWQAAHPVWPDTRNDESVKVYTATILRPVFAEGWRTGDIEGALKFIKEHPL